MYKFLRALQEGHQLPPRSGETRPTSIPISDQASRGHSRSNKFPMPSSSLASPHVLNSSPLTDWYWTLLLLNSLSRLNEARLWLLGAFLEGAISSWRVGLWLGCCSLPWCVVLLQLTYGILVVKSVTRVWKCFPSDITQRENTRRCQQVDLLIFPDLSPSSSPCQVHGQPGGCSCCLKVIWSAGSAVCMSVRHDTDSHVCLCCIIPIPATALGKLPEHLHARI